MCRPAEGRPSRTSPPWVRDPLGLWLSERWDSGRAFRFHVEGSDPRSLRVSALP